MKKKRGHHHHKHAEPASRKAGLDWKLGLPLLILVLVAVALMVGRGDGVKGVRPEKDGSGSNAAAMLEIRPYKYKGNQDPELRKQIPWRQFALKDGALDFAFEKRLTCNVGDFEAIEGDLRRSTEKRLLVTVESLVPGDTMPPVVLSLGESVLRKGYQGRLRLPRDRKPRQLGLFVCKDSEGTGRCGSKELVDINRILAENEEELTKKMPPQAQDRIYYFQYLYQAADGTVSAFRHGPVPEQAFASVDAQLDSLVPGDLPAQRKALDRAKELSRTIASVPLRMNGGYLRLTLPAKDVRNCPEVANLQAPAPRNLLFEMPRR